MRLLSIFTYLVSHPVRGVAVMMASVIWLVAVVEWWWRHQHDGFDSSALLLDNGYSQLGIWTSKKLSNMWTTAAGTME